MPDLSYGGNELTANEDAVAEEPQAMFDAIRTLLNETGLDDDNVQVGGLSLNRLVEGDPAELVICNASGVPQYREVSGAISISNAGVASLVRPSVGSISLGASDLLETTGLVTVCSSPALASGLYAVWGTADFTSAATNDYTVNVAAHIACDGVQVSTSVSTSLVNGESGGVNARGSCTPFQLVSVATNVVLALNVSADAAFVATVNASNTRLRYARLFA